MKRIVTLLATILITAGAFSQGNRDMLVLPKDNGSTISFCESINIGQEADAYFDSVCTRIQRLEHMKGAVMSDYKMVIYMHFNQMGHGVFGTLTMTHTGEYVNYCFQDYRIDSYPMEEWLTFASPNAVESVKSAVFSKTVITIAAMKHSQTLAYGK